MRLLLSLLMAAVTLVAAPLQAAEPTPRRIVSLNPCLDAILLEVADPGQIAALSRYSASPAEFAMAAAARPYRHIWGEAEEVATLRPDLVLISGMGPTQLEVVLPRLHIRAANFGVPETVAESIAQVRRIAALAGHPDRGEALVECIRAALRAAKPKTGEPRLSALIFEARGQVSGPRTLANELMADAGFQNAAARYGLAGAIDLPLERLLADPPQVLLSGQLDPQEPSWADRALSHPALKGLGRHMRKETFPAQLLFCAGPVLIPAAAALARARQDAERPPS